MRCGKKERNCNIEREREIVECKQFVGNTLTTFPNTLRRALLRADNVVFSSQNRIECLRVLRNHSHEITKWFICRMSTTNFRFFLSRKKVCYGYMVFGVVFFYTRYKQLAKKRRNKQVKKVKRSRHKDQFQSEYSDWFGQNLYTYSSYQKSIHFHCFVGDIDADMPCHLDDFVTLFSSISQFRNWVFVNGMPSCMCVCVFLLLRQASISYGCYNCWRFFKKDETKL